MKAPNSRGLTIVETLIVLFLVAVVAVFLQPYPFSRGPVRGSVQTKQINNVKQIILACQLYAIDHAGVFPTGRYDPTSETITEGPPADSAEACFNDLIRSGKLEVEKVFWSPQFPTQCSPGTPDEDGTLDPKENCWDYIAGLNNESPATLPLAFDASDGGTGKKWTKDAGHPWENIVVVGFVDGSAAKENLNSAGEIKIERDGNKIDLCVPTPGLNLWPESAKLTPATPVP